MGFHNIEKSKFRPGEYVGYGRGEVYRIYRSNGPRSVWTAQTYNEVITARTLREISERLDRYTVRVERLEVA